MGEAHPRRPERQAWGLAPLTGLQGLGKFKGFADGCKLSFLSPVAFPQANPAQRNSFCLLTHLP